jgi:hypothetical protein
MAILHLKLLTLTQDFSISIKHQWSETESSLRNIVFLKNGQDDV